MINKLVCANADADADADADANDWVTTYALLDFVRYKVAENGQFLQWGSLGKFFICCLIELKFRLRVRLEC